MEWFASYAKGSYGCVKLGNDYTSDIIGLGDVHPKFPNGSLFVLQNVRRAKAQEELDFMWAVG